MAKAIEQEVVSDMWWIALVQGIVALLFGIAAVFWPGLTLKVLVYLFGAFVLAWGVMSVVQGIMSVRTQTTWWLTLIFGIIGVGVGLYLVRHPLVSFSTFIVLIGFTLIFRGVIDIIGAFVDEQTATSKVLWVIAGLAAVLAGIFILNQPVSGGVAFVWVLGLYSLVFGPLMIALSLDLKRELKSLED